jgi:hypothetical protein
VIPASGIAYRHNIQTDLFFDFADGGVLGDLTPLYITRYVDVVFRNISLLDKSNLGAVPVNAKANHAGVRKWEKRAIAAIAVRRFPLVAADLRKKLFPALGTKSKIH